MTTLPDILRERLEFLAAALCVPSMHRAYLLVPLGEGEPFACGIEEDSATEAQRRAAVARVARAQLVWIQ